MDMISTIFNLIDKYGNLFVDGVFYTVAFSAATVFFGAIFGTVLAFIKMSKIWIVKMLSAIYIELIRGTPLLLQLYFFYFFIPNTLGLDMSKEMSILVALVVNSSAYVAEIIRAGIQAVDKGQTEAARSLGLSQSQAMMKIVIPQAIKNILPALANEFVMIIKETSLASTFFLGDLMTQFRVINGATYLTIEPLIIVGAIYLVLTFTLSKIVERFERRMSAGD